jgi:hypothetical protein
MSEFWPGPAYIILAHEIIGDCMSMKFETTQNQIWSLHRYMTTQISLHMWAIFQWNEFWKVIQIVPNIWKLLGLGCNYYIGRLKDVERALAIRFNLLTHSQNGHFSEFDHARKLTKSCKDQDILLTWNLLSWKKNTLRLWELSWENINLSINKSGNYIRSSSNYIYFWKLNWQFYFNHSMNRISKKNVN